MLQILRTEIQLIAGWVSVAILLTFESALIGAEAVVPQLVVFIWLFATIMWGAFTVVRHAEELAHRLGEPYGTLILTMSVTIIEVSFIFVVMLNSDAGSTLARDTIFAVLMITLNGMAGICMLVGGMRHREQSYNLQGAQAFLAVIIPLAVVALILPNFTTSTEGPTLSHPQAVILAILTVSLYGVFLAIQTVRHTNFFTSPDEANPKLPNPDADTESEGEEPAKVINISQYTTRYHTILLLAALVPVVIMTEELAHIVESGIETISAPEALAGVLVAILVLSPEAVGAVRAALANQLQRAVNIALGSALATISLTVPSVLIIGVVTGRHITFGLPGEEMVLLALTLIVCTLTFSSRRTNVLQGAVHLVLFAIYAMLLFNP